jgi:D-alanyl-D-alanine carboxypeptidase
VIFFYPNIYKKYILKMPKILLTESELSDLIKAIIDQLLKSGKPKKKILDIITKKFPKMSKEKNKIKFPEDEEDEDEEVVTPNKKQETKKSFTTNNNVVDDAIKKLTVAPYNLKITQDHIDKEFDEEGTTRKDSGGINQAAEKAVLNLIKFCKKDNPGIGNLGIISHYRSYDTQVSNFGNKAIKRGIDDTQKWVALPGFSQHHTGKAFDIFSLEPTWWESRPKIKSCIENNAKNYNLKVTYTKENRKNKFRGAEPWHLFYTA